MLQKRPIEIGDVNVDTYGNKFYTNFRGLDVSEDYIEFESLIVICH